jgi:hypothetical protein
MSQNNGYYSLIQFSPDPSRLEAVNIGIVVYSSSERKLSFRITRSNQRVRKFFGNQDWRFLNRAKSAIANRLRSEYFSSVEDFEAFISRRANDIQLTHPRQMRISEIQQDVQNLFERLVGNDLADHKCRITSILKKKLMDAEVANLVSKTVSVEIPDFKRAIRVPYAYQNGRFNLISPVQFDPETDILAKTGKSAIEGKLLYEHPDPVYGDMRLVVVSNFEEGIEKSTREFVNKIFRENRVTVYSLENLDPLVEDIRRSAAEHSTHHAE